MVLSEMTKVADTALPVAALKDHLRLGTGFSADGMQDGLLVSYLRAALAVVEARTGKAVMARRFKLRLPAWRKGRGGQALPVAPVSALVSVAVVDTAGALQPVDTARYRLEADLHRPCLRFAGDLWPDLPEGGVAEVIFDAGFGADWGAVPADLAQAVILLAAEFYERRHEGAEGVAQALPLTVQALLERWRVVRVLGGGAL